MFCYLALMCLFVQIHCDIPVHCRKNHVVGEWVFHISTDSFQPSLENPKTSCSHGFPDHIDNTIGDHDYSFPHHREVKIKLNLDDTADNGTESGQWTSVYDEGVIINIGNSQYTVFLKYFKNEHTGKYESNCDKTMIGWFIPDVNNRLSNWSCFYGFKAGTRVKKTHLRRKHKKCFKSKRVAYYRDDPVFLQTDMKVQSKSSMLKYEDQKDLVERINKADLTWKADFNDNFKGMSFAQLNEHVGSKNKFKWEIPDDEEAESNEIKKKAKIHKKKFTKKPKFSFNEKDSKFVKDPKEVTKYLHSSLDEIDVNRLPKNWDWRNVGGESYVPPIRNQGDCGSCYIFSSVTSLECRLRVQTHNKDRTVFSKQYPISCNFYTEGCKGGYPILVGKFFNEFELIPESCFPYEARNVDCRRRCDNSGNKRKYFVSNYGYLGGYYGATNEELMMKEIRARGPIPGNILVPYTFSYYKKGVYSFEHAIHKNNKKISEMTLDQRNLDWQKVEHSITIVGYGEKNGIKYWIGMNTWGTGFGENGFFKILRGENECNIESMGDYFQIAYQDN